MFFEQYPSHCQIHALKFSTPLPYCSLRVSQQPFRYISQAHSGEGSKVLPWLQPRPVVALLMNILVWGRLQNSCSPVERFGISFAQEWSPWSKLLLPSLSCTNLIWTLQVHGALGQILFRQLRSQKYQPAFSCLTFLFLRYITNFWQPTFIWNLYV